MNWINVTLSWYSVLLLLGLIFFPLTRAILGRYFYDRAYPFSKTLAIIMMTYSVFILGLLKILPFRLPPIIVLGLLFLGFNVWLFLKWKKKVTTFELQKDKKAIAYIIFEELLFVISLICFMFVRSQEPSIHGLEKFMDYGFMKSILRSEYFPPLDMWLSADPKSPAGYFINYYYFGHLTGAFLMRITQVPSEIGYNLILGTLFAQGITMGFSFCSSIVYNIKRSMFEEGKVSKVRLLFYGILGTYLINLSGNLHTIYAFTKGYNPDTPVPFWTIFLSVPEMFDTNRAATYWYPNATRFIPKTIHEFPAYSYVVADLHGHVFDIPFVLFTLSVIFTLIMYGLTVRKAQETREAHDEEKALSKAESAGKGGGKKHKKEHISEQVGVSIFARIYKEVSNFSHEFLTTLGIHISERGIRYAPAFDTCLVLLLGFMTAIHYMTNALNGPIYLLMTIGVLFILYGLSNKFLTYIVTLGFMFFVFSYPFSMNFVPFASGVGMNCAPKFLTDMTHIGPFLFEKGNCQKDTWWMLFVLWGFFWMGAVTYVASLLVKNKISHSRFEFTIRNKKIVLHPVDVFALGLFFFGTFLITIPEFFYVKDIYPDHFRANTMFKLGYQAFIMMSIATTIALFRIRLINSKWRYALKGIFVFFGFFVVIYPYFAFPSYYPGLLDGSAFKKPVDMNGAKWLADQYPQDWEIIQYFNNHVQNQPIILEAQGDSYTDYDRVSAFTGLPTVAGWWVHEWLWRGSPDVVGGRIPDVETIYEGADPAMTLHLLQKYNVEYVVISGLEREKYKSLDETKFQKIATQVFKSSNGVGSIYKVNR